MQHKSFVFGFYLLSAAIFFPAQVFSATFNVEDVTGFQTALTTAQNNGEDDTINVAAGTYNVSSTLTYDATENNSLAITGASSTTTILDGGSSNQLLNLISRGNGSLAVSGLTIQNGRKTGTGDQAIGGGIFSMCEGTGSITIENSTISNNSSAVYAGGVYTALTSGTVTVSNCTISNNTIDAGGDDAAGLEIYIENAGHAVISNSTISNNTIGDTPGGSCDGAGVFIYLFETGGTVTIQDSTISSNTSHYGIGGLFCRVPTQGEVTISNNTFRGNSSGGEAVGYGGGGAYVEVENGTVTVANNIFTSNESHGPEGDGGGLWLQLNNGSADVRNNVFADNTAERHGGGANLYFSRSTSNIYVAGNLFVNNQADTTNGAGGGATINSETGTVSLVNNTCYGNTASEGGGVNFYTESGSNSLNLYNEIYWNNTPNSLANSGSGTITAANSDIQNGTGQSWFGRGCIDTDPMFTDASSPAGADGTYGTADDGLHLATGSPGIDTGSSDLVPSSLSTDLTGADRIQNGTVDMGAYEGTSGTVTPYLSISISPSTISENAGTATATLTRDGTETTEALNVNVSSSDTSVATVPEAVTISAGESSVTFTVSAVDDSTVEETQTAIITVSANDYRSGTATISVTDDDGGDTASVTLGSVLNIEPSDLTDFSGTTFPRKPKVVATYDDPVKNRDGRAAMKVYYDRSNNESVDCEWKKKIALFNKRAIDRDQTTEEYIASLTGGVIPSLSLVIQVTSTDDNGDKATYDYSGTVNLVPPVITQVTDEDGNVITSAAAGDTVILTGTYFGIKKPTVWLEYRDDNGNVKTRKCRVLTGDDYQLYEDHNGKPGFMNIQTGASTVYFQIPPRFPNGWNDNSTEHNIVLDNKIGRATVDFSTGE